MTDPKIDRASGSVVPIWMGVVEDAVAKFKDASVEEQQVICGQIAHEYKSEEAGAKAREFFSSARVELEYQRIKSGDELARRRACAEFERVNGNGLANRLRSWLGLMRRLAGEAVRNPVAGPKVEPEAEVEEPRPEDVEVEEAKEVVRLNLSAPYDIARTFIRLAENDEGEKRHAFIGKIEGELVRKPTLWHWKGDFKRWNGQFYSGVDTRPLVGTRFAASGAPCQAPPKCDIGPTSPRGNRGSPKQRPPAWPDCRQVGCRPEGAP